MSGTSQERMTWRRGSALINKFVWSVIVIVIVTGLGKLLSAMGEVDILAEQDPLFSFLTYRQMMLVAALLELGVAGYLLVSGDAHGKLGIIASLGMVFLTYRLGLWSIGYEAPCSCLGAFTEAIGIGARTADGIMKGVLAYMLLGSFWILAWEWLHSRKERASEIDGRAVEGRSAE